MVRLSVGIRLLQPLHNVFHQAVAAHVDKLGIFDVVVDRSRRVNPSATVARVLALVRGVMILSRNHVPVRLVKNIAG